MALSPEELGAIEEILGSDFILIALPDRREGITPINVYSSVGMEEMECAILGAALQIVKREEREEREENARRRGEDG